MHAFLFNSAVALVLSIALDLNYLELALIVSLGAAKPLVLAAPFDAVERYGVRLARNRRLCIVLAFVVPIAIRVALLPWAPIPDPWIPDEFSHLLIADTLAHGRLANPVHPLWTHFESIHILTNPVYASSYFPGLGMVMALGQVLGHPWVGVLLSSGAMCAALLWMLYGFFPPRWAVAGGAIAVIRWGALSYWVNSYWGGTVAAAAGAVVLGAYGRLKKRPTVAHALAMGAGLVLLAYTRPLEGVVFACPVAIALFWRYRAISSWATLARIAVPVIVVVVAGLAWLGYYFRAITGDPFVMPYRLNQVAYGWPLTLPWERLAPATYRHYELQLYYQWERCVQLQKTWPTQALVFSTLHVAPLWRFFWGPALSIPMILGWGWWKDGRIRLALICSIASLVLGLIIAAYPHYIAPATGGFLAITLQAFRRLRLRERRTSRAGVAWSRIVVVVPLAMLPVRALVDSTRTPMAIPGLHTWSALGSMEGSLRADIGRRLQQMAGQHVVFVQYRRDAYLTTEWVYNEADLDSAKVVWVRDMEAARNEEVRQYFPGRTAWIVKVDEAPEELLHYDPALARASEFRAMAGEPCFGPPLAALLSKRRSVK